jgi:two-component system, OmpR family, response regulator ResD
MDFVMPVMDGPTATRAIRAMHISTPIFGLTGNALESDVAFFLNSGADSILIKPFSMVEFLSSMASVAIRMAAQSTHNQ